MAPRRITEKEKEEELYETEGAGLRCRHLFCLHFEGVLFSPAALNLLTGRILKLSCDSAAGFQEEAEEEEEEGKS